MRKNQKLNINIVLLCELKKPVKFFRILLIKCPRGVFKESNCSIVYFFLYPRIIVVPRKPFCIYSDRKKPVKFFRILLIKCPRGVFKESNCSIVYFFLYPRIIVVPRKPFCIYSHKIFSAGFHAFKIVYKFLFSGIIGYI